MGISTRAQCSGQKGGLNGCHSLPSLSYTLLSQQRINLNKVNVFALPCTFKEDFVRSSSLTHRICFQLLRMPKMILRNFRKRLQKPKLRLRP